MTTGEASTASPEKRSKSGEVTTAPSTENSVRAESWIKAAAAISIHAFSCVLA